MGEVESKIERLTSTYSTLGDAILAQSEKVKLLIAIHQTYNSPTFNLERSIFLERKILAELEKLKISIPEPDKRESKITWKTWIRKKLSIFKSNF